MAAASDLIPGFVAIRLQRPKKIPAAPEGTAGTEGKRCRESLARRLFLGDEVLDALVKPRDDRVWGFVMIPHVDPELTPLDS